VPIPQGTHTLYYFSVDSLGNTETVGAGSTYKVDSIAPGTVTVTGSAGGATSANLSWSASTDSGSGVWQYRVYDTGSGQLVATTSGTSTSVSGLATSTAYSFAVRAVDTAGNQSALSTPVSVRTDGDTSYAVSTGDGVQVDTPSGLSVRFDHVTAGGTLSVSTVSPRHPWLSSHHLVGGAFVDVHPVLTFTGLATVVVPYNSNDLAGATESSVRLFHWSNGAWQDITISVNTVNHTVTGQTNSFSDFGVGAPLGSGSGSGPVSNTPASSEWSLVTVALGALAVAAVLRRVSAGRR
jgi:chitodextrinase